MKTEYQELADDLKEKLLDYLLVCDDVDKLTSFTEFILEKENRTTNKNFTKKELN